MQRKSYITRNATGAVPLKGYDCDAKKKYGGGIKNAVLGVIAAGGLVVSSVIFNSVYQNLAHDISEKDTGLPQVLSSQEIGASFVINREGDYIEDHLLRLFEDGKLRDKLWMNARIRPIYKYNEKRGNWELRKDGIYRPGEVFGISREYAR